MNIVTHNQGTITALLHIAPETRAGRIRARDLEAFTHPMDGSPAINRVFDGKKLQFTKPVSAGPRADADAESRQFARSIERGLKLPLNSVTFQPTVRQLARRRS